MEKAMKRSTAAFVAGIAAALAAMAMHAEAGSRRDSPPAETPAVAPASAPVVAPTIAPTIAPVIAPSSPTVVESYSGSEYRSTTKAYGLSMGASANTATCHTPVLGGLLVYESQMCAWRTACDTLASLGMPQAAVQCACQHETARKAMEAAGYSCKVGVEFRHGPIGPQNAAP